MKTGQTSKRQEHKLKCIVIGDLEYDPQHQCLLHDGLLANLTLCESKIVAYLFSNDRRNVSAHELLSFALGCEPQQKTTAAERHICTVRRKIAAIGATTTIRTIRYQGYVIK